MNEAVVIGAAFFLLNCVFSFFFYRYLKKKFSSSVLLERLRAEVNTMITALDQAADRDVTILEARIDGLKKLIDDAQKAITLASREEQKRGAEREVFARMRRDSSDSPTAPQKTDSGFAGKRNSAETPVFPEFQTESENSFTSPRRTISAASAAGKYRDAGLSEPNQRSPLARQSSDAPEVSVTPAKEQITPQPPIRERILTMARQGFDADFIAEKLSVSVEEVEIVISLG